MCREMASISFKENLIIEDKETARKLATALRQPRDTTIRSDLPPKLPKDAGKIWFKR